MTSNVPIKNGQIGASSLSEPLGWDPLRYILYNESARAAGVFTPERALQHYRTHKGPFRFEATELPNKTHIVTLLGYTAVKADGDRHTNWFPWNRFFDAYREIGYRTEWIELPELERQGENRIFVTWNEPTSLELYESGKVRAGDIVLQKVTSLGKGMENVDWTGDAESWCRDWEWPLYRTVEYLADIGCAIHAFGCRTAPGISPEKDRIVDRLSDRMHWIPWGGTPFSWPEVLSAQPTIHEFTREAVFIGSKWGRVGRGNIDAWDRYLSPLEKSKEIKFEKFGGIGQQMVSDDDMASILKTAKICPIIHAPSWQAERGIQDRFYTVFLSGRFGICDNLGAIDVIGDEIAEICTIEPQSYFEKTLHFANSIDEQIPYINHVQEKIKQFHNFYVSWFNLLMSLPEINQSKVR